jgi:hypothetical protein
MNGGVALALTGASVAIAMAQPGTSPSKVALPVLPGAVEVLHERIAGYPQVRYEVREPLPASEAIERLVKAMAEQGWALVELGTFREDPGQLRTVPVPVLRSGIPSASLLQLLARLPPTHTWEGRWRDGKGREATFHLSYDCPLEQQGLHSVWVQVWGEAYSRQEADKRARERQRLFEERQRIKDELCRSGVSKPSDCGK